MDLSYIDKNVLDVRQRIASAAARGEACAKNITLLAAIKSAEVCEIEHLCGKCGVTVVGENRVQQLMERYEALQKTGAEIHFIGSLQTNKVKYIIDKVSLIHSLDSERLALEIQKQAQKRGMVARVLVEINSGDEQSKGGIKPEEAEAFCLWLKRFRNIEVCGFMTMAPKCENKENYYPYFEKTRDVAKRIWRDVLGNSGEPILSMGMSESFEQAIECGANMIRVGRSLFNKN